MVRIFALCGALLALFSMPCGWAQDLVRDPTQPINYVPSAQSSSSNVSYEGLKLNGIFESARPTALINGKRYHVGETVEGYKVSSIRPSQVVLTKDQEKLVLKLYNSSQMIIK